MNKKKLKKSKEKVLKAQEAKKVNGGILTKIADQEK